MRAALLKNISSALCIPPAFPHPFQKSQHSPPKKILRMKYLFFLLAVVPGFVISTAFFTKKSPIEGRVLAGQNRAPIANASVKVMLHGKEIAATKTDSLGQFSVEVEAGTYDVVCATPECVTVRTVDVAVKLGNPTRFLCILDRNAGLDEVVVKNYVEPPTLSIPVIKSTAEIAATITHTPSADGKTRLSGKIVDKDARDGLIGSTVRIMKGTVLVKGVVTDIEGNFQIELEPGTYAIEVSYTGYTPARISGVTILSGQLNSTGDIDLPVSGAALDEVVVTGYSTDRRKARTASKSAPEVRREAPKKEKTTTVTSAVKADKPAPAPVTTTAPAGVALSSEDIKKLPTRNLEGTIPDDAVIKGSRARTTVYYIDGVRVSDEATFEKDVEEETKLEEDESPTDGPGAPDQPAPHAGLLTAGEWNDLHNWNKHWLDLLTDGEIDEYQKTYNFFPKQRFTVLLTNAQDFPVADASVRLLTASGENIWTARTDNTGKAELWAGLFDNKSLQKLRVEAEVKGVKYDLGTPKDAKAGINRHKIEVDCNAPKNVDIVWAVDATGSMGDEIEYLKTELLDVIGRAKANNPDLAVRMGTVFYRDQGDEYITKSSALTPDIAKTVGFIRNQFAGGGGDYPEAVHSALEEAIFNQPWSETAIARICFVVLDASPHQSPEINASLERSIREAARRGIRIVPVTASGIQKDTEFLMKFFGLATNGTYVFLTDHSGIGGKHLEPTSDEYKVEPLNDLLVRLITEYTTLKTCQGQSAIRFEEVQQQNPAQAWQALYYPNPANTQFTLDLPFAVQSVTIYNSEGQAVRKLEKPQEGQQTVSVNDLSAGFYTIRILKDGQMQSGKLMVVRG